MTQATIYSITHDETNVITTPAINTLLKSRGELLPIEGDLLEMYWTENV